jgi:intein-encoded DNA endonuclease-like protein
MNDLIKNIDKIHTTELGIIRIKRNLELETNDVVKWCKNKIKNSNNIVKKGKNWYVNIGNSIITVNAYSYTIITAHKINKV